MTPTDSQATRIDSQMTLSEEISDYITVNKYALINSVIVSQNGKELVENYYNGFTSSSRNHIKSVAKSITSIATGIALDKGLLKSLDEPIWHFIPQFNENREFLHKRITVRHLLTMTSGIFWNGGRHYHCPMIQQMWLSGDWIDHIADCAVTDIPGTKHNYKEWDVILLAKVLDVVTGDMFDFINNELFIPLGISSNRWYKSKCGVYYSIGGGNESDEVTSNLTAREMLQIGKLFLNGGTFEGKRIISQEYINQTITPSITDPHYGMMWWLAGNRNQLSDMNQAGNKFNTVETTAVSDNSTITENSKATEIDDIMSYANSFYSDYNYSCRGYGGQRISVFPQKNAVIIVQATATPRCKEYDDLVQFCAAKL